MSKTKIDDRIENALNAFFETDNKKEPAALSYNFGSVDLEPTEVIQFTEKADFWTDIARQALLFFHGALLLYFAAFAVIFFYDDFGISLYGAFWLFAGSFMCFAGAGSLRNTRNVLIPLSIVSFAILLSLLFTLLPAAMRPDFYFYYSIYGFPFVLVMSKLLSDQHSN